MCSYCVVKKPKKAPRKFVFYEEGLKLLAKRLKEIRCENGFIKEYLAYESELSLSQIARIEKVKINPTVSKMFIIARILNIPVSSLFDFKLSNKKITNLFNNNWKSNSHKCSSLIWIYFIYIHHNNIKTI